jgi:hypothetical protein
MASHSRDLGQAWMWLESRGSDRQQDALSVRFGLDLRACPGEPLGYSEDLAATQPAGDPVTLRVLGYTRAMDESMGAADLLVGKPGGLPTAEALARGAGRGSVGP